MRRKKHQHDRQQHDVLKHAGTRHRQEATSFRNCKPQERRHDQPNGPTEGDVFSHVAEPRSFKRPA